MGEETVAEATHTCNIGSTEGVDIPRVWTYRTGRRLQGGFERPDDVCRLCGNLGVGYVAGSPSTSTRENINNLKRSVSQVGKASILDWWVQSKEYCSRKAPTTMNTRGRELWERTHWVG